jgi:hypothetical protein
MQCCHKYIKKLYRHTCCRVNTAVTAFTESCENLHQNCDSVISSYWRNEPLQQLMAFMTD